MSLVILLLQLQSSATQQMTMIVLYKHLFPIAFFCFAILGLNLRVP